MPRPTDLAATNAASPLLPWLAFGLVLGDMAPGALAASCERWIGWHPRPLTIALIIAPLPMAGALLAVRRSPLVARWSLFALACVIGTVSGTSFVPTGAPGPWLASASGEAQAVAYRGHRQGFVLADDDEGPLAERRLFVRAPGVPEVRSGDRVAVHGAWDSEPRGEQIDAVALTMRCRREDGARGWAWDAVDRVAEHRELAAALLLGQGTPPERFAFRDAGILHILSVSGTHVAIALAVAAWLLRSFGLSWRARIGLLAATAVAYCWLTGGSPATQRSAAMSLAMLAALACAREPHRLAAIALAAAALIAIDPQFASDIGFQLSLGAVAGIVTLGIDLMRLRARLLPLAPWPLDRPLWRAVLASGRALADGLAIGLAATLATAPLVAWHFAVFNAWSPLTTLAATPPTTGVLWFGLPCLLLSGAWPSGPWEGLYAGLELNLSALTWVAEHAALLPGASIAVQPPSALALCAWPMLFTPVRTVREAWYRLLATALMTCAW